MCARNKMLSVGLVLLVGLLQGCAGSDDGLQVQAREQVSAEALELGSCQGFCGDFSDDGCYCDEHCVDNGDCCPDYDAVCNPPECQELYCLLYCELGFKVNDDGCRICECIEDPCAQIDCPEGTHCAIDGINCLVPPCEAVAACVPDEPICPEVLCTMYCEFGFELDENGCEICVCRENPCNLVDCPPGTVCEVQEVVCVTVPCYPQAMCVPEQPQCPDAHCPLFCDFGFVTDENGCEICECAPNPCFAIDCADGYHCELQEVVCVTHPCPPVPMCVPDEICPPLVCAMYCEFGFVTDENGCEICECRLTPCATVRCAPGYHCEARPALCDRPPCDPPFVAECVPDPPQCPDILCPMHCEFGYVIDDNGCQTCECKLTPCATVRCAPGYRCEARPALCDRPPCDPPFVAECVPDEVCQPAVCPLIRCEFGLERDENGCEICQCKPNPCSVVLCAEGTHCEVQEIVCVTWPCDPIAACVPDQCEAVPASYVGVNDGCDCPANGFTGCDPDFAVSNGGGGACGCDYCYE